MALQDFENGRAVVIGATGGVGAAVADRLEASNAFGEVVRLSRSTGLDVLDEASVEAAAAALKAGDAPRLVFVATGALIKEGLTAEKTWKHITPDGMAAAFALNATGPALVMKHMLPLLPRRGHSAFAVLSARVGSIGDNSLGGWYSYRASKAALNQIVRSASVELARTRPDAVLAALHPGTVDTGLGQGFAKAGLDEQAPNEAAARLVEVIGGLTPADTGGFFDHRGETVPW